MHSALWIFAKWPEPGRTKTRLSPPLSPTQAAELSQALLLDQVRALRESGGLPWGIAFAPDEAEADFRAWLPGVLLRPQGGGDLGERMSRVIAEELGKGSPAVLLLGADVPLLPPELPVQAAEALLSNHADLVLSPAPDGGYSMIGIASPQPELFRSIPWSGPEVLALTLRRAESLGLRVRLTEPVPDCDSPEDLQRLRAAFHESPRRLRALAPHLSRWLEDLENSR
jgi:rSAM/selenodomain-associated transferase 1